MVAAYCSYNYIIQKKITESKRKTENKNVKIMKKKREQQRRAERKTGRKLKYVWFYHYLFFLKEKTKSEWAKGKLNSQK